MRRKARRALEVAAVRLGVVGGEVLRRGLVGEPVRCVGVGETYLAAGLVAVDREEWEAVGRAAERVVAIAEGVEREYL